MSNTKMYCKLYNTCEARKSTILTLQNRRKSRYNSSMKKRMHGNMYIMLHQNHRNYSSCVTEKTRMQPKSTQHYPNLALKEPSFRNSQRTNLKRISEQYCILLLSVHNQLHYRTQHHILAIVKKYAK